VTHADLALCCNNHNHNHNHNKATAIGNNNQAATSILKQEYKEGLTLNEALKLAVVVLSKTMDNTSLQATKRT